MKALKRRFVKVVVTNPYWSSYLCFCEAIRGQGFTRRIVSSWFYRLVDKGDYFVEDGVKDLVRFLCEKSTQGQVGRTK